jgi:hypothetical protein
MWRVEMVEKKKKGEGWREDGKVAKREEGARDGQREANMAHHGQAKNFNALSRSSFPARGNCDISCLLSHKLNTQHLQKRGIGADVAVGGRRSVSGRRKSSNTNCARR